MNRVLGTDINADRRTVEDQDIRFRCKPFGKNDLLLITAGESGDRVVRIGGCDLEVLDPTLLFFGNALLIENTECTSEFVHF